MPPLLCATSIWWWGMFGCCGRQSVRVAGMAPAVRLSISAQDTSCVGTAHVQGHGITSLGAVRGCVGRAYQVQCVAVQGCLLVVWAAWCAASFHCFRPIALDPHLTEEGCTYVPILGTFVGRVQQAIGVRDTSDWYAVCCHSRRERRNSIVLTWS